MGLLSRQVPHDFEIVQDTPARLNHLLIEGELDISPISALQAAEHADEIFILPNLSISSESGVKSVLLFSKVPIEALGGKKVMLTVQGKSTPALLRMILEERYGVKASFYSEDVAWEQLSGREDADAFLLIGDAALKAKSLLSDFRIYDLAEEWRAWTSLPFVFAVWAVRRDYYKKFRKDTEAVQSALGSQMLKQYSAKQKKTAACLHRA